MTTSANWISNFSIAMCTPLLLDCDVLGVRGTFFLMGVFLTLSYIFVLFTTPETKVLTTSILIWSFRFSVCSDAYLCILINSNLLPNGIELFVFRVRVWNILMTYLLDVRGQRCLDGTII